VLHRCAKRDRDRRFHALYDKVARGDVLWRAWGEVRANRGAPGVDGITIDDVVPFGVGEFLDRLAEQLRPGTYRPRPLRRTYIPEPGKPGQLRPLGIPCLADRVVMAAAIVLEPIFEADFLPASYGFRPRLSAHHALETVRQTATWRGKQWVLDADSGLGVRGGSHTARPCLAALRCHADLAARASTVGRMEVRTRPRSSELDFYGLASGPPAWGGGPFMELLLGLLLGRCSVYGTSRLQPLFASWPALSAVRTRIWQPLLVFRSIAMDPAQ
jgi:hypothetical protein